MKETTGGCIPELSVRTINILKNNGLDPWDDALIIKMRLLRGELAPGKVKGLGKFVFSEIKDAYLNYEDRLEYITLDAARERILNIFCMLERTIQRDSKIIIEEYREYRADLLKRMEQKQLRKLRNPKR